MTSRAHSVAFALIAIAGCGPSVSEVRLGAASPRAPGCDLDFIQFEIRELAPGGTYEVLGHVTLSQGGVQDPLQPQYREIVRPRACAMGGEAVGVLASGAASPWALSMGGTATDYVVLRRRPAAGAKAAPQHF